MKVEIKVVKENGSNNYSGAVRDGIFEIMVTQIEKYPYTDFSTVYYFPTKKCALDIACKLNKIERVVLTNGEHRFRMTYKIIN